MSKFEDIDNGRLIYTCNCGWVDLGHANPRKTNRPHIGAMTLWEEIQAETGLASEHDDGFLLTYRQDMGKFGVSAGESKEYFIRRKLNKATKKSIALTIFMEVSIEFETMQGKFPFGIFTGDSSFSQEDLVSNLIGFYRAVEPGVDFLAQCQPVSKEASKDVWKGLGPVGSMKNRSFQPVFKTCKECSAKPAFPKSLQTIVPAKKDHSSPPNNGVNFRDWVFQYDRKSTYEWAKRKQQEALWGPKF